MKTNLENDPEVRRMAILGAQEMLRSLGDEHLHLLGEVTRRKVKRNLSAAGRKRIAAAQCKRWAKARRRNSAKRTKKGA